MRPSRAIAFWVIVIAALLFVEVAELTHLFTLPVQSALGNLLSFVFALVFTTILALIGALFVGIYISQRLQSPGGFTRFEEEMLRMRKDVERISEDVQELRRRAPPPPNSPEGPA
ncbi:MAG: hypothetical protein L3K00_07750 [Thermoplasmata archaeon]|nr:hypothetical protein [Thermoplasmata archaeon]